MKRVLALMGVGALASSPWPMWREGARDASAGSGDSVGGVSAAVTVPASVVVGRASARAARGQRPRRRYERQREPRRCQRPRRRYERQREPRRRQRPGGGTSVTASRDGASVRVGGTSVSASRDGASVTGGGTSVTATRRSLHRFCQCARRQRIRRPSLLDRGHGGLVVKAADRRSEVPRAPPPWSDDLEFLFRRAGKPTPLRRTGRVGGGDQRQCYHAELMVLRPVLNGAWRANLGTARGEGQRARANSRKVRRRSDLAAGRHGRRIGDGR